MFRLLKQWRDQGYVNIYGAEVIDAWCRSYGPELGRTVRVLDVGCGSGRDLMTIRDALGAARHVELYGIESSSKLTEAAAARGVRMSSVDLEFSRLPYQDAFFDIVLSNQVLEHLKNWIWALHEQFRVTRVGGMVIVGVPNMAALHNRILILCGRQPTCVKANGPHVRGFTLHELQRLAVRLKDVRLQDSKGTFVYGFPPAVGKWLGRVLPQWSATVLLALRKTGPDVSVLPWLDEAARFETNYFVGEDR